MAYYVSACKDNGSETETCDDSEAQFWTLYVRDDAGLSQGIIDLAFREDAEAAMAVYVERDDLKALAEGQSKLAGRNAARAQKAEAEIARRDAAARDPFGYMRVLSGLSFQIMEGAARPPDRSGDSVGPWFPIWTTTPQSASVPDGWKLVPIKPTEDMVISGFESKPDEHFSEPGEWDAFEAMSGCKQAAHKARLCYAAMLAAAPAPGGNGG